MNERIIALLEILECKAIFDDKVYYMDYNWDTDKWEVKYCYIDKYSDELRFHTVVKKYKKMENAIKFINNLTWDTINKY